MPGLCFNTRKSQTDEAEVKPSAHPQRVPGAEKGAKSGAAQWSAEGGGKGRAFRLSIVRRFAPVSGQEGCWPFQEAAFWKKGKQGGTAGFFLSLFSPMGESEGGFFIVIIF